MALLGRSDRRTRIAFAAMLLSAAGCMFLDQDTTEELGPAFSHATHVAEGLECSDCHGDPSEDEPRMPSAAQCQLCHAELDVGKEPDEQALAVLAAGAARIDPWDGGDVIFAHLPHVTAEMECSSCHPGIESSERVQADERLSMDECMQCHAQRGTANECATCHVEIRAEIAPQSHEFNWLKSHGQAARAHGEQRNDRCTMCHKENECITCHTQELPENHTNFWRLRGHGVAASMDRDVRGLPPRGFLLELPRGGHAALARRDVGRLQEHALPLVPLPAQGGVVLRVPQDDTEPPAGSAQAAGPHAGDELHHVPRQRRSADARRQGRQLQPVPPVARCGKFPAVAGIPALRSRAQHRTARRFPATPRAYRGMLNALKSLSPLHPQESP